MVSTNGIFMGVNRYSGVLDIDSEASNPYSEALDTDSEASNPYSEALIHNFFYIRTKRHEYWFVREDNNSPEKRLIFNVREVDNVVIIDSPRKYFSALSEQFLRIDTNDHAITKENLDLLKNRLNITMDIYSGGRVSRIFKSLFWPKSSEYNQTLKTYKQLLLNIKDKEPVQKPIFERISEFFKKMFNRSVT